MENQTSSDPSESQKPLWGAAVRSAIPPQESPGLKQPELMKKISEDTKNVLKNAEEPDIHPLPDFDNQFEQDPRVPRLVSLAEHINNHLPQSFRIQMPQEGKAELPITKEWQKISEHGQEKRLLWALQHAMLPAIAQGIREFKNACTNPDEKLTELLPEQTYQELCDFLEIFCILEQIVPTYMGYLQDDNPESFGEGFKEKLRLRNDLENELSSTLGTQTKERRTLILRTLMGLDEELSEKNHYTDFIRSDVLQHFQALIDRLPQIFIKILPKPLEENEDDIGTPLTIPSTTSWLPDILSSMDLSRLPEFPSN